MGRELQHLLFWEQHCCLPSAVGAAEWSRHSSAACRALKGNGRWQEPGNTDARSWNFMDSIRGHLWGQNVWLLWKKAENGKGCCWLPSSVVYDLGNQYIGDQHLLKAKAWGLPTFLTNWIIVKTSVLIFADHILPFFGASLFTCTYMDIPSDVPV